MVFSIKAIILVANVYLVIIFRQGEGWTVPYPNFGSCRSSFSVGTRRTDSFSRTSQSWWSLYYSGNDKGGERKEDWRDVRAKLIQQYRSEENHSQSLNDGRDFGEAGPSTNATATLTTIAAGVTQTKWAYDSGNVIEHGSLIVSNPVQDFACGGLKQQYFHKCVVLVVQHDAHFTKGVILNRPTRRSKLRDKHNHEWTVWFAGDVQGLHSPHPDYTCLHRLKSPRALEMSLPVVKDIHHTTWELAKLLVQQGEAWPEDFWLGCGYAGWWPKQLQDELERGNWFMVATDSESILELLQQEPADNDDEEQTDYTGIQMWEDFMGRIDQESLVKNHASEQTFQDAMLKEWIHEKLLPAKLEKMEEERNSGLIIQPRDEQSSTSVVQEGTIYSTSRPTLLDEQVFHQALVIILKTDERGSIGAILNRPSSSAATLKDWNLPLRYGGRFGLENEGKPETWLHCGNEALRKANVGVPIVPEDESLVWQCSKEDAETAVEMDLASPSEFLVVHGLTLWEKNPPSEGFGKALTKTSLEKDFECVPNDAIPHMWKKLLNQTVLGEDTFSKNMEHSRTAYQLASQGDQSPCEDATIVLADEALERWIRMFLMKGKREAKG